MEQNHNRLAFESSPYLLQHAGNPVDWHPWGEEAFARARAEDLPIFLSIGYSTCHWCHVMARESFEDKEIASLLNRSFISIKVDREERPDVDQLYMAATQVMSGSGGWPTTLFLFPDGSPFFAGTYFPPRQSVRQPGFIDLLEAVGRAWRERRSDLRATANQVLDSLRREQEIEEVPLDPQACSTCLEFLARDFDGTHGGFGGAPKFPRPVVFSFLFSHFQATGEPRALEMALFSLRKMAAGGICDQLGGGFHRYSVDSRWFVPHFEKMLYDQAQLACSYLEAYRLSGDELFARVAQDIFSYVLRDLRDPAGGFFCAEDADSSEPGQPGRHGEGAFYLWREEEIVRILGVEDARVFALLHGVEFDGNVRQDPMGEFTGRNILSLVQRVGEAADTLNFTSGEVRACLDRCKQKLLQARAARPRPHCDDKVITSWNGLMISALARGGRLLGDQGLLDGARRTAVFIREQLYQQESGLLLRRWRLGKAGLAGQLDDYAFLAAGLLELYQVDGDLGWLAWARDLTDKQIDLFWNEEGGFFYDSAADPTLLLRLRGLYDGAEAAGNSVAALNLIDLAGLDKEEKWLNMAKRLLASFGATVNRYPPAMPLMLVAWQRLHKGPAAMR